MCGDSLGPGSGGLHSSVLKLYPGDTVSTGQGLSSTPTAHSSRNPPVFQRASQSREGCRSRGIPAAGRWLHCGDCSGSPGPRGPKSITSSFAPGARPSPTARAHAVAAAAAAGGGPRWGGQPLSALPQACSGRCAEDSPGCGAGWSSAPLPRHGSGGRWDPARPGGGGPSLGSGGGGSGGRGRAGGRGRGLGSARLARLGPAP